MEESSPGRRDIQGPFARRGSPCRPPDWLCGAASGACACASVGTAATRAAFDRPARYKNKRSDLAADIYAGYFAFGGKIINAHGRSPFELERYRQHGRGARGFWLAPPSRAAIRRCTRQCPRLVDDFLSLAGAKPNSGLEPRSRAAHARLSVAITLILDGATALLSPFHEGLGRTQLFLERKLPGARRRMRSLPRSRSPNSAYARKHPQSNRKARNCSRGARSSNSAGRRPIGRNPRYCSTCFRICSLAAAYAARGLHPRATPQRNRSYAADAASVQAWRRQLACSTAWALRA